MPRISESHARKFRQAAFVYLHVAILYEMVVYVAWGHALVPTRYGPPLMWLIIGAVVGGAVFVGLLRWQNVWLARVVWFIHALRLPEFIERAFFPAEAPLPPRFYLTAIVVVLINLWMLARAGWDL